MLHKGQLPLLKLHLADNGIGVGEGVALVRALQAGTPQLQVRSLARARPFVTYPRPSP